MTPNSLHLVRACFPGSSYPIPDESFEVVIHENVVSHVGLYWRTLTTSDGDLDVGGIGLVCTHPQWRGCGLASALMEAAYRRSCLHQCPILALFAGRAEGVWYETRGFTRHAEITHLYVSGPSDTRVLDTHGLW